MVKSKTGTRTRDRLDRGMVTGVSCKANWWIDSTMGKGVGMGMGMDSDRERDRERGRMGP